MRDQKWLDGLTGGESLRAVATRAGVSHTTIGRQLAKGRLDPELVIALARAYDVSPIDALVDTGYIDPDEITVAGIPTALGYATNSQILEEIRQRTDPDAARLLRGADDPEVITPDFGLVEWQHETALAASRGEVGVPDIPAPGEHPDPLPDDEDLP